MNLYMDSENKNPSPAVCAGYVFLKVGHNWERFYLKDILHIEADGNQSYLYKTNNLPRIILSMELCQAETLLKGSRLVRCHRSHIVNVDYVKIFTTHESCHVVMENAGTIPVSDGCRINLLLYTGLCAASQLNIMPKADAARPVAE